MDMKKFNDLALSMRRNIIRQTFVAGVGHTGGALSMVEIIISIYEYYRKYYSESNLPHVVISKGHAAACLYAWLAEQGHIEYSELDADSVEKVFVSIPYTSCKTARLSKYLFEYNLHLIYAEWHWHDILPLGIDILPLYNLRRESS